MKKLLEFLRRRVTEGDVWKFLAVFGLKVLHVAGWFARSVRSVS